MWWWERRLVYEPTASADAVIVKRSPRALAAHGERSLSEDASEAPDESVRSSGGTLSISELTWCHVVVGQSPDP